MRVFLICILMLCVSCSGKIEQTIYEFDGPNNLSAVIKNKAWNYYLEILDDGDLISKYKVGIGVTESGVSSAMWHNQVFALKLVGDNNYVGIYIYNYESQTLEELPVDKELPKWVKFTKNPGFYLAEDVDITGNKK